MILTLYDFNPVILISFFTVAFGFKFVWGLCPKIFQLIQRKSV